MRSIVAIALIFLPVIVCEIKSINFGSKPTNPNEEFHAMSGSSMDFKIECEIGSVVLANITKDGKPIDFSRQNADDGKATIHFEHDRLLANGPNRYQVEFEEIQANGARNETTKRVMIYFGTTLVLSSESVSILSGDQLKCEPQVPIPGMFIEKWWWSDEKSQNDGVMDGKQVELTETGTYKCHVKLAMKFSGQEGHTSSSESFHGEGPRMHRGSMAAIVTFAVILLLAVVVVAVFCVRSIGSSSQSTSKKDDDPTKKLREDRQKQAAMMQKQIWMQQLQILQQGRRNPHKNAVLRALLEEKTTVTTTAAEKSDKSTSGDGVLNYVQLKRETARLISMRPRARRMEERSLQEMLEIKDRAEIMQYMTSIADVDLESTEVTQPGLIEKVVGCRAGAIPMRTDTCVELKCKKPTSGRLHMNRIKDYYDCDLLICQAPLKTQFGEQWQAIWENSVGVVVWIGAFEEHGKNKMDPYIPLKEAGRVVCGEYHVTTMFVVRFEKEFDVYRVQVKLNQAVREVLFIHVHMWPDHCVPREPAQLADLILQVQGHQLKQAEHSFPTVLVHCSVGVQRSPAFLAVYIASQMWYEERRAHMLGILRYIRRRRWRAFGYGDPFAQIQIVFGVMQVIAMRQQMEGIANLAVAADEERVFDIRVRSADLSNSENEPEQLA